MRYDGAVERALGPTQGLPASDDQAEKVRKFRITVVEGTANVADWQSSGTTCSIGSHPSNDLVLDDDTVSRFHCEIAATDPGFVVRDLRSKNGTVLDGVRIETAYARGGSVVRAGKAVLRFDFGYRREANAASFRIPSSNGAVEQVIEQKLALFAIIVIWHQQVAGK